MQWYNPQGEPFRISGFPFYQTEQTFRRMPLSEKYGLPEAVYDLADETAGGQIRFRARLKRLCIRVSLAAKPGFFDGVKSPHLAVSARSAFDLYLSKDGREYTFYSVAKDMTEQERFYTSRMLELDDSEEFDILLNFPLYGGVDRVLIGVDDDAEIFAPRHRFADDKKLVMYGTSIQQGACAGRPGMAQSNLLSRWLNREVYNLGFNSSGKGEAEVARVVAGIRDTAALMISIEGNCPNGRWLDEKLRAFLEIYRAQQPDTPVIIMPFIISGQDSLNPRLLAERLANREVQKAIVDDCFRAGDQNIYLFLQEEGIPRQSGGREVWHECTVDGLHYNDLGFYWVTEALCRFLEQKTGISIS